MRCPKCDGDNLNESLDGYYETIYTCEECGCVFKYDIVIIKGGRNDDM